MEIVSAAVLDRIRDRCETRAYYRACIFCNDRARARVIQDTLINSWPTTEGNHRLSSLEVRFPATGSFVRILTSGEVISGSARGNRFHELCIDVDDVHMTIQIRDALNRMVVPHLHDDHAVFRHVDTRYLFDTFDVPADNDGPVQIAYEQEPLRGHRANFAWFDEPMVIRDDIIEVLNKWRDKCYVSNADRWKVEYREAPDLGEFSPSQELNNFVNTLVQG